MKIYFWETYREISPRELFPLISLSQASEHSWTTSMAYLKNEKEIRLVTETTNKYNNEA